MNKIISELTKRQYFGHRLYSVHITAVRTGVHLHSPANGKLINPFIG